MTPALSTFILGVCVILAGIISPLLIAAQLNSRDKKKLEAEYARQDELSRRVNDRLEAVATKVEDARVKAEETATLLVASNAEVAATAKNQSAQLQQIHVLVNSNLTAYMQETLDTRKAMLVLMDRLIDTESRHGVESPSEAMTAEVEINKAKIAELEAQLSDRLKATEASGKPSTLP